MPDACDFNSLIYVDAAVWQRNETCAEKNGRHIVHLGPLARPRNLALVANRKLCYRITGLARVGAQCIDFGGVSAHFFIRESPYCPACWPAVSCHTSGCGHLPYSDAHYLLLPIFASPVYNPRKQENRIPITQAET